MKKESNRALRDRSQLKPRPLLFFVFPLVILIGTTSPREPDRPREPIAEQPPLHQAISDGDTRQARALLEAGADVEEVYIGRTPLNAATLVGEPEIVSLLLKAGAQVDSVDYMGETVLFLADTVPLAAILLDHGADPNHARHDGRTPLHVAIQRAWVDVTFFLLENGALVGIQDRHGFSPLSTAASNGLADVVSKLLEEGADVDHQDSVGGTALLNAAAHGQTDVVRLLLESGADPNHQNTAGDTALHYCAVDGYLDLAQLLLSHGARPDLTNQEGLTPLDSARTWAPFPGRVSRPTNKEEVIKLLESVASKETGHDAKETIVSLVQDFFAAQLRGDAEANRSLCSERVVYLTGGRVWHATREDLVERSRSSIAKWRSVEIVRGPLVSIDKNGMVAYVDVTVHGIADLTMPDGSVDVYDSVDVYLQVWSETIEGWRLSALAMNRSSESPLSNEK